MCHYSASKWHHVPINATYQHMKPLIGISSGYKDSSEFSPRPHLSVSKAFSDLILANGGIPFQLPLTHDYTDILHRLDGVILTDGRFPFPESWYHNGDKDDKNWPKSTVRGPFEEILTRQVLAQDLPVLGICCGMQMLAAAHGGTFYRNFSNELNVSSHLVPGGQPCHDVHIKAGTQLHKILGVEKLKVNSLHNEALYNQPESLIINATADNNIIEGIEIPQKKFAIGVQWHPEITAPNTVEKNLFKALVEASCER